MAKINSGNKPQIQPQQAQTPIQSGQSAQQVSKNASVAQKAPVDAVESQSRAKPAASSPLSATLMAGLSAVADRYYGSEQVAVNPRLQTGGKGAASEAQIPAEAIALKANSLARKTGIPAATAQEIVKLATYILS